MAATNTTSVQENEYLSMPHERQVAYALEMAKEIKEQDSRLYCLAASLRDQLENELGDDRSASRAFGLAELLSELMTDSAQFYRLLDCLEAMQPAKEVCNV